MVTRYKSDITRSSRPRGERIKKMSEAKQPSMFGLQINYREPSISIQLLWPMAIHLQEFAPRQNVYQMTLRAQQQFGRSSHRL